MKIHFYIPILIVLFLSACTSDEASLPPEPDGQGNVTFLFTAGSEITTRTVLDSPENLQHVEWVYLYIFSGTGNAATYSDTKEIPWPKPGDVGYQTTERRYSIALPPGDYTFLAIGLDDRSGETYNFPAAIATGTTLADAKAVLATGKTKENIARSELFAGYTEAIGVKESGNPAVTIDLWRRVAGVLGYFKNAPDGTSKIQISLYTQQNGSGYLLKQIVESENYPYGIKNPANFNDYITSPISSAEQDKILVSIDVPTGTAETDVLSGGAYMLPVAAPLIVDSETEYTLLVEAIASDGSIVKTMKAKMKEGDDLYISETGGGTGIMDISGPFRFPIVANHFYAMGTKDAPIDLGGGDDIVITVDPGWQGIGETIPLE